MHVDYVRLYDRHVPDPDDSEGFYSESGFVSSDGWHLTIDADGLDPLPVAQYDEMRRDATDRLDWDPAEESLDDFVQSVANLILGATGSIDHVSHFGSVATFYPADAILNYRDGSCEHRQVSISSESADLIERICEQVRTLDR